MRSRTQLVLSISSTLLALSGASACSAGEDGMTGPEDAGGPGLTGGYAGVTTGGTAAGGDRALTGGSPPLGGASGIVGGSGGDLQVNSTGGTSTTATGGVETNTGGDMTSATGGADLGGSAGAGGLAPTGGAGGTTSAGGTGGNDLTGGTGGTQPTGGSGGAESTGGTGGAETAGGTGGAVTIGPCSGGLSGGRVMECLDRGVVGVNQGSGTALVSWRLLGTDPANVAFNVYRGAPQSATLVCSTAPGDPTNCIDTSPGSGSTYFVRPVIDAEEGEASGTGPYLESGYLSIPLRDAGDSYVHLAWIGDLDGDGELDYVVDRIPNAGGRPLVDAYRRDGTFLWRIDLGPNAENRDNIEGGASVISNGHWDGLTVFDFDVDGRAEVAIKTANGVIFGDGSTLQHGNNEDQFVSIVHGETGTELARTRLPDDYLADGPLQCHFGAGYLDGRLPSVITKCKNRIGSGAFNLVASTYDFDGASVTQRWKYLRGSQGGAADYHQIRIVDVDGDGRDELADGGYVIDDNGQYLYGVPGAIHGDRFHIGDLDPDRPGLEGFGIQQDNPSGLRFYYYAAHDGQMLRAHTGDPADLARGTAADLDPRHRGYEYWTFDGLYTVQDLSGGPLINEPDTPWPNFRIWWDGDTLSELLNQNWVAKWNYQDGGRNNFVFRTRFDGLYSWRDAVPAYGDYFGDWREEILMEGPNHDELRIFATPYETDVQLYTLLHNPEYRNCLTVHGYRQSTMVDYYLGDGMSPPPQPPIELANRVP